ncbi:MAG: MerR family transcriptional regulator [Oscillospiraceae bacterium]|jgi:DNA-binding transcriptional MerR regulator
MKMKQVCSRTGLTERTVRFYEEQGLVSPRCFEENGRVYRAYSEQDLADLEAAATLRKSGFTVAEIKRMKASPMQLVQVVQGCAGRLREEGQAAGLNAEALAGLDMSRIQDCQALAAALERRAAALSLPRSDLNLDFGKDDDEPRQQKEAQAAAIQAEMARRQTVGRRLVYAIGAVQIALAFLLLIASAVTRNFGYGLVSFVAATAFAAALMCGVRWVRWYYAVSCALSAIQTFLTLLGQSSEMGWPAEMGWLLLLTGGISCVLNGAIAWILIKSKAAAAFFEEKQHR